MANKNKKYFIEYTQMIGEEPEPRSLSRQSERTAKKAFKDLQKDPNVKDVKAYELTPTEFTK